MSNPDISYLTSSVDAALTNTEGSYRDCIIQLKGCTEIADASNNYPSSYIDKCTTEQLTLTPLSLETAKYRATLQVIVDLFELLLLKNIKNQIDNGHNDHNLDTGID